MTKIVEALLELAPEAKWSVPTEGTVDDIEWITDGTKPTNSEIETKRLELVNAEPMRLLREERNARLSATDWEIVMHKEKGTNIPTALKTYRQELRDITDNATSLDDVTWPTKP